MSVNEWHGIGNLGKDPELRYTPSGKPVASFSIAITDKIKGEDKTEWINIVVWNKLAEVCGKYLSKGKKVYIKGRLQTRKYDDRDGVTRYVTEVVAYSMEMLSPKEGTREPVREPVNEPVRGGMNEEPVFDPSDEIPFSYPLFKREMK